MTFVLDSVVKAVDVFDSIDWKWIFDKKPFSVEICEMNSRPKYDAPDRNMSLQLSELYVGCLWCQSILLEGTIEYGQSYSNCNLI